MVQESSVSLFSPSLDLLLKSNYQVLEISMPICRKEVVGVLVISMRCGPMQ
jgi:hypothetical protein